MTSRIEKIEAVANALIDESPVKQLCASCVDHRICHVSRIITDVHIANCWVTLRCVKCVRYEKEKVSE